MQPEPTASETLPNQMKTLTQRHLTKSQIATLADRINESAFHFKAECEARGETAARLMDNLDGIFTRKVNGLSGQTFVARLWNVSDIDDVQIADLTKGNYGTLWNALFRIPS